MSILNIFRSRPKKSAAGVAKDRLQIIVAHERTKRNGPDYLPLLKQDLINVIAKYVTVDQDQVNVNFQNADNCAVLELNITLPEAVESE